MAGFWREVAGGPVEGAAFLFWIGLMPALLTALGAMIQGLAPVTCGARPWNLSGLILASIIPLEVLRQRWKRLLWAFAIFLLLLSVLMLLFVGFKDQIRDKPSRTGWPDQALSGSLQQRWRQHTDCPLQLVAVLHWLAETVAINLSPRASAIPDADLALAPWADLARTTAGGLLI